MSRCTFLHRSRLRRAILLRAKTPLWLRIKIKSGGKWLFEKQQGGVQPGILPCISILTTIHARGGSPPPPLLFITIDRSIAVLKHATVPPRARSIRRLTRNARTHEKSKLFWKFQRFLTPSSRSAWPRTTARAPSLPCFPCLPCLATAPYDASRPSPLPSPLPWLHATAPTPPPQARSPPSLP